MSENLNKQFSPVRIVEDLTAAKTLDVFDSGKIFTLNLAGGFNVTLPSPTADDITGVTYTFIVKTSPDGANYTLTLGTADLIVGQVYSSTGGDADSETSAGADVVNFVDGTAVQGDRVELVFDGVVCYAYCFCNADGGITLTG